MPDYSVENALKYFSELNFSSVLVDRCLYLFDQHKAAMGFHPDFFFVEDHIADGNRIFRNIVMLSNYYYVEFGISENPGEFACWAYNNRIEAIFIPERINLSFGDARADSRLTVQILLGSGRMAYFNSTGLNCYELLGAVQRYFIPNMKASPKSTQK